MIELVHFMQIASNHLEWGNSLCAPLISNYTIGRLLCNQDAEVDVCVLYPYWAYVETREIVQHR